MPVPKRKLSKSRTRQKRNKKVEMRTTIVKVVKKDGSKAYKRPHIEEHIEL